VAALARRWGGTATLASRPEGGAIAEIRLPASMPNEVRAEPTPSEAMTR
jgi:hypothetical protein